MEMMSLLVGFSENEMISGPVTSIAWGVMGVRKTNSAIGRTTRNLGIYGLDSPGRAKFAGLASGDYSPMIVDENRCGDVHRIGTRIVVTTGLPSMAKTPSKKRDE